MPQKGAAAQWYSKCNSVFQVVGSILDSVKVAPGLVLDRICLSDEIFFIISGCLTANSWKKQKLIDYLKSLRLDVTKI